MNTEDEITSPSEALTYALYLMLLAPDVERGDEAARLAYEIAIENKLTPIEVDLCAINAIAWVHPDVDWKDDVQ